MRSEDEMVSPPLAHFEPHDADDAEPEAGDERKEHENVSIVVVQTKPEQLYKNKKSTNANKDPNKKRENIPTA